MINLLPTDSRQDTSYARRNSQLLRWSAILVLVLFSIGAIVLAGQFYMRKSINAYSVQLAKDREALKVQKLDETQARLEEISSSVKLVLQVLSKEVLFSKLLRQLGSVMPADTVLLQLQIDKVQGALELRAGATNIDAATQLQLNLEDPANQIFQKADIENINCNNNPADRYPCTVNIKALFLKNNPFLFISKDVQ